MDRETSTLFQRLKRRKVVQWTIAYLSAAWLVLQVVDVVGEQFGWPGALERGITVALAFGFLAAVVVLLGTYERARAEESMGRLEDARTHYHRFIDAYDHPVEPLRPLVDDARSRLDALMPRVRG